MVQPAKTVVLVHGAWHGAWCWAVVQQRLDAAGVPNVAVDNPSVGSASATLADDADNVMRALDAIDGPVVLVGHSYGGAVITDAGAHPSVDQLVYVSAFALAEDESVVDNALSGGEAMELASALDVAGEVVVFNPDRAVEFFYHDCDAADAAAAVARLAPMSMAAMSGVPRAIAWRTKPSTFIVCTDDRALPVALQQSSGARTNTVIEMAASHSPFLSRPDEFAAILIALIQE